jgi:hypothetical protein
MRFSLGPKWALAILSVLGSLPASGQVSTPISTAPALTETELVSNGDFSSATTDPKWPDDWKARPGITWENENGTHFLRFSADKPGTTLDLFREIPIPVSPGIKRLHVSIRFRTRNLKVGPKMAQDARAIFRFYDTVRIGYTPEPPPLVLQKDAPDWTTFTSTLRIPEYAASLEVFLGITHVDAGTLDIAEVSMKEEATPITAAPPMPDTDPDDSKAAPPIPIHREGTHTIIGEGTPSIWFINPYADILGHNFDAGLSNLVRQARDQGASLAVGVAPALDEINQKDEADTIYVFSYKNIDYPLPAQARRLVFLNTWLTGAVKWPDSRAGRKDVVLIGSKILNNNSNGLATDKARWIQIQKDDPALTLTVLEGTGYYLPSQTWGEALLKIIIEDNGTGK